MLTISFSKIKESTKPLVRIDDSLTVRSEFLKRSKKLLLNVKKSKVTIDLFYSEPYVTGNFHVVADLIVPSSRSLKPVEYHEDFSFSENYSQQEVAEDAPSDDIPVVQISDDMIDLQTAVEDNILLNIPVTILTKEEKELGVFPTGKDWEVVSEDDFQKGKQNQVNPAFAKLKVLLDKDKE